MGAHAHERRPATLDLGYPVPVMALRQTAVASLMLILLPLSPTRTRWVSGQPQPALRRRVALNFFALGLGCMALEIPFLQHFSLFLSHPLYAVAMEIAAFLVCAALGARFSERVETSACCPFAGIAAVSLLNAATLPRLLAEMTALAQGWNLMTTMALIAPLALCLGMPVPVGLAAVAAQAEALVPWVPGTASHRWQWRCGDPARHPVGAGHRDATGGGALRACRLAVSPRGETRTAGRGARTRVPPDIKPRRPILSRRHNRCGARHAPS